MANVSWVEILWISIAFIGLVISVFALVDAIQDLRAHLAAGRNGYIEIVARGNVRDELIRLGIQWVYLLIGVLALTQPPSVVSGGNPITQELIRLGLVVGFALLIFKSLANRHDRHKLMRMDDTARNDH